MYRNMRDRITLLCVALGLLLSVFVHRAHASEESVLTDDLIFPQKIAVMDGVSYVMDQGSLVSVKDGVKAELANIKDLPEIAKYKIQADDLVTFRPAHMAIHKGVIYVSGNIHRDYGNGDSTGAVYAVIASYSYGKFSTVLWQREQDSVAPIITDWNDFSNPQVVTFGNTLLYDYLGKEHTRPAMGFVGDHMYFTYFGRDQVNMEGLAMQDLTTKKVKKLIEGNGFDYMSGAYTRMDYWKGNGPEYTVIPSDDEKRVTIIDGDRNIYQLDLLRHSFKRLAYFGSDVKFMTKGKVRDGMIYYVNDRGMWKQDLAKLTERPVQIFDPKTYRWGIEGGIGMIADWDFVDDDTINLLDFTNHRIVNIDISLEGDY